MLTIKKQLLILLMLISTIVNSGGFGARSDGATPIDNRRATSDDVTKFSSIDYSALAKVQTYIFVSFSMPDATLKSYYLEAQKIGAALVIRGLVDNSFIKTKAKAEKLAINFNIDPNLFEQYQITSVPVIIVDNGQGQVKKLTGHIALLKAMEIMEENIGENSS